MRLLYKPLSMISRGISSKLAKTTFRALWSRLDGGEPPAPTASDATLGKVLQAAVLEAATMAAFGALAERSAAATFHYLFGVWPGEKRRES